MFDEKSYSLKMDKAIEVFSKELSSLRTGRANAAMLDLIKVDVGDSELDALMGSVNTIVKWKPVVIFRNDLVVDFFKELRYNIKKHDSDWIAWYE